MTGSRETEKKRMKKTKKVMKMERKTRKKDREKDSIIMKDETRRRGEHNNAINSESMIIRMHIHAVRCVCTFHSVLIIILNKLTFHVVYYFIT